MNILVIEDNHIIADNIRDFLMLDGHDVSIEYDGTSGLQRALWWRFDCVVLDLMLPGIDWLTICSQIREKKNTPIIMTTAKGTIDDKGDGFRSGADDYLVKPFSLDELSLRVTAVTKRIPPLDAFRLPYNIEIFPTQQRISKDGNDIKCTSKEFLLCTYLASNSGRLVSRGELCDILRENETHEKNEATLDVYIANLRKKLNKNLIETVRWWGYMIPLL
jgi:DNA-binding response OmpR family regulator